MKKQWEYYDYRHFPYKPPISTRGKLSSDIILSNSLLPSIYKGPFSQIKDKIRDAIGPWNTVWGVKLDRGAVTWELYFYSHGVMDSPSTLASLLKALRSYFKIPTTVRTGIECQPYVMFSIDLSDGIFKSRQIKNFHFYIEGKPGISHGNSYYWGLDGMYFENYYHFYRVPQEMVRFIDQVKHSKVLGKAYLPFLKHDLVKKLMTCYSICVAQKKNKDGVYFSRVNIAQLLFFLEYFSYPSYILNFIKSHKKELDHLLYDVAFDCTLGPKGLEFGKSSYYGIF